MGRIVPFYPTVSIDSESSLLKLEYLKFNHCFSPYHLYRFNIVRNLYCEHCNGEVIAELNYFIFECCNYLT